MSGRLDCEKCGRMLALSCDCEQIAALEAELERERRIADVTKRAIEEIKSLRAEVERPKAQTPEEIALGWGTTQEGEKERRDRRRELDILINKIEEASEMVKNQSQAFRDGYSEGLKSYVKEYREVLERRDLSKKE